MEVAAGGDGSGDGDGSGGPGGDGSTDGASGDGRNGGNGCGDPVCPITGRVFLEVLDFGFWGPLPIRFVRHYSSRASDQVGELGRGYTHVYGWELKVLRDRLVVRDGNARKHVLEGLPTPGAPVMDTLGIMATCERGGFEITDTNDGLRYVFGPELKLGIHRAVAVRDRYGNTIQLERDDKGTLKRIIDSAGRPYTVAADDRGLIRSIRVAADERASAWIELVRYEYDEESRLVAVTDAEGFTSRLEYVGGLLVAHRTASGLTYHYRYDGETKHAYCVETWGSRSGPDPALETPIKPRGGPKGIHYAKLTYDKQARYAEVENGLGGRASDRNSFNNGTPRGQDLAPYPSRPWAGSVRLYPQCRQCSNSQGGLESHATGAQREASRRRVVANNRAHSGLTVNSPRT